MALIGQIRKNMWFVFILLGLALIAFMMMDSSMGGRGGSSGTTAMEVNGEKIDIQEFNRIESVESSTSGLSGNALRSKVYDNFIVNSLVKKESESLGLGVPEEEMDGLLFGFNPSPVIQRWFRNPQTGRLDFQQLQQVKNTLESGDVNPNFLPVWETKKKEVVTNRLQEKIGNMISKGIYTPDWMANELTKTDGMNVSFDYVRVPTTSVDESSITLTDADYKAYMNANPSKFYANEEGKILEYVVFDIDPTVKDSMDLKNKLAEKKNAFLTAKNDSLYAITNGGNYQNYYFKADELPEAFQNEIATMDVGSLIGPYKNNRFYTVVKLIDRKMIPDSVQASHILRKATPGDEASFTRAQKYIDSLMVLAKNGTVEFSELASANSEDQSNASKGGDLGYFVQGSMVPEFNDVVFVSGQKKGLYSVRTQFGVHLINVNDVIYSDDVPKSKVAFINTKIMPSTETVDQVIGKASEFITNNRSLESMRAAAASNPNVSIKTSKKLSKKDYAFEEFGYEDDARNIIIWAFDDNTSVGDVSPDLFSFRDKQFNYESKLVIPALQAEIPKGNTRLADVKNSITQEVLAFKKGTMLRDQMSGKSLADIASSNGTQVETINAAALNGSAIQGLGYEPAVVAAIINNGQGVVNTPIVGNNGVYKLNIKSKNASANAANSMRIKNSNTLNKRRQVFSQYFEALKKTADVEDNRMNFKM